MKNVSSLLLFTLLFLTARGQYYYKDILGTKEAVQQMKLYKANKVRSVSIRSLDADGMFSDAFAAGQSISPDFRKMTTVTKSERTDPSFIMSYFDEQGQLISTVDSAENLFKTALYKYRNDGQLSSITYMVRDSAEESKAEEHQWIYSAAGKAEKMLRITDTDSTITLFSYDEAGNMIEEKSLRDGIALGEPYNYYYNDANRLTDIARYNRRANKILPDYMFEYSESGQVIQMVTVPSNSAAYLIWRYLYDANGLKTKEACYGKNKELLGKIEYQYSMGY